MKLIILLILVFMLQQQSFANPQSDDCLKTCGIVPIPYPFGIGQSCALSDVFSLDCNSTYDPPRPFNGVLEFTSFSLDFAQAQAMRVIAYQCYNTLGPIDNYGWKGIDLNKSPFRFSYTENVFTAVGCDTVALIKGWRGQNYHRIGHRGTGTSGCISMCEDLDSVIDGSCSGIGCCQTTIPQGVRAYTIDFENNHSQILDFNPCSYGFIVKKGNYTFHKSDLRNMDQSREFPMIFDWAIGNLTCREAKKNMTEYACVDKNSDCRESTNGPGYTCHCRKGFRGNPYLNEGCKDIDECKEGAICKGDCVNTIGSYTCTCPPGTSGNATGDGCFNRSAINRFSTVAKLGIAIGVCLPLIFIIGSWGFWVNEKRKLEKLKEDFFRKNGGLFLKEHMKTNQINTFTIFTMAEMENATKKFNNERILGRGGNGIVYKGFLQDNRTVAVKKSMMVEASKNNGFANEMLILSQVNHVNVVKLLGCCLEVEVPILVYEYIPNGTLYDLIHDQSDQDHLIPWDFRLKVLIESAKALVYLHFEASPPILHGDIKSANILLGDQYIAKVSDFGTSTLTPNDKSRFMTLIQGTYGYLDPRYLETGELTQKSDVYSFGVVMVELLTGKKAIYKDEFYREKTLVFEFKSRMKEGKLLEILDPQLKDARGPSSYMGEINVVASVALRCLGVTGEERPTMSDVLKVLDGLKGSEEIGSPPELRRHPSRSECPSMKSETVTNVELSHIGRGR